uniref:Uncharacterized protein n=1 Tax=Pinctada fucata TaxID=50426 RepID=A0A194ANS9_PINFU
MKILLILACLASITVISSAVHCGTTSFCRENNHAHMQCENGQVACISHVCTCYTPSNNTVSCSSGGRADCLGSSMTGCDDTDKHCVDGICVCTHQ